MIRLEERTRWTAVEYLTREHLAGEARQVIVHQLEQSDAPQGPPHQGEPRADASAAGSSAALWDEAAVGCVQKNRGETNIANNKTVPEEDFADRMLCNIRRYPRRQLLSSVWSWRPHTAPGSTSSGILR